MYALAVGRGKLLAVGKAHIVTDSIQYNFGRHGNRRICST